MKKEMNNVDGQKSKLHGSNLKPHKSQNRFWLFLFLLLLINFFWFLGTTVSDMLIDELVADFGGSYLETRKSIQFYDSLYQYAVAISVILFGILIDKYSQCRKKVLILINSLWIIMNVIIFLVPINAGLYIIMQIIWGISMGAHGPIVFSYLGDLFRIEYRGRLFSIFAFALYFIKGSSNVLTGIIGGQLNSWKYPLFITAIGGAVSIMIFAIFARDPQIAQVEPEFMENIKKGGKYGYRLDKNSVISILSQKSNLLFIIQGFFGMFGVTIVNRYLLYWLTSDSENGGLNMNEIAASFLLFGGAVVGAIIGIPLAGKWADAQFKKGRLDKMLYFPIACIFGEVIGYALLIYLPNYPDLVDPEIDNFFTLLQEYPVFWLFVVIFNACMFCGTAIGPVVGTARTHLNLPEQRATAAALYDTADFIGAAIALSLGAIISENVSRLNETIFYGALFWLLSGIIWIFILKHINNDYRKVRKIMQERALKNLKMDSEKY